MLTAAVVNSGFEAKAHEVILPLALASVLGLDPTSPGAQVRAYGSVSGPTLVFRLAGAVRARVVTADRTSSEVIADVVLVPLEREALISDSLGGALALVLLDLALGEWCFSDELGARRRPSESPRAW